MEVIILKEVKDFVTELGEDTMSRVQRFTDMLTRFGYRLRMPYSKNILPGIFELRIGGIHNIRLMYTFSNDTAIVFYGFEKKTEQISLQEMNTIKMKFNRLQI